uniref:Uncharacterized protein n=1 Tax=Leptocylindrus danicus TaxID=163516 RepID=A0A7S2LFI6_9STRA|mmetsp:Transcript_4856/g.7070  ORF Transcript_4856/g.7070 Transcript_4856/m.7070 type:complete len:137 (+) Transcript_4856:69-479(+)
MEISSGAAVEETIVPAEEKTPLTNQQKLVIAAICLNSLDLLLHVVVDRINIFQAMGNAGMIVACCATLTGYPCYIGNKSRYLVINQTTTLAMNGYGIFYSDEPPGGVAWYILVLGSACLAYPAAYLYYREAHPVHS